MNKINKIETKDFNVEIIRTNRLKTASVRVREGAVSIVVPKKATEKRIKEIIDNKTVWILSKLQLYLENPTAKPKEYCNDELFYYLGAPYKLSLSHGTPKVEIADDRLNIRLYKKKDSITAIKKALQQWYQEQAQIVLFDKVIHFAEIMHVIPNQIKIKTYKARWGSCTSKGDIQLNWKIIMAPSWVIDYVVIHELCHLKQLNHSAAFWHEVEIMMPDYKKAKEWFKHNGALLQLSL